METGHVQSPDDAHSVAELDRRYNEAKQIGSSGDAPRFGMWRRRSRLPGDWY